MKHAKYADVLVLTALPEERFILDRYFAESFKSRFPTTSVECATGIPVSTKGSVSQVSLYSGGSSLSIAWTDIGGMGNVWAYDETLALMETLSPRFVMMLGLAAGWHESFARGDVGYSRLVGFSTFGKYKEGLKPRRSDRIWSSEKFYTVAHRIADHGGTTWRQTARDWYSDAKSEYERKYLSEHGQQSPFGTEQPKASVAIVASGDAIIADKELQLALREVIQYVDDRTKQNRSANLFEMEAYGVALCCKKSDVPFGMIKGISDLGGEDKEAGSKEADAFRLAAIASSTAMAFAVLMDETFIGGLPDPNRRYGWSRDACVWSLREQPLECVHRTFKTEEKLFNRHRPCTDLGLLKPDARELLGSRVFEKVESQDYSVYLSKILENAGARFILVFPYGVRDLLSFHWNTSRNPADRNKVTKAESLLSEYTTDSAKKEQLASLASDLGKMAYIRHPHFRGTNQRCAQMIAGGSSFEDVSRKVCRIMCVSEAELEDMRTNPAFLMHIEMCGLCVPTLLAYRKSLDPFGADEATYLILPFGSAEESPGHGPIEKSICLKYSDRSKLLVALGICSARPPSNLISTAHDFSNGVSAYLNELPSLSSKDCPSGVYEIFPVMQVFSNNCKDWSWRQSFPGFGTLTETELTHVEKYFKTLQSAEKKL